MAHLFGHALLNQTGHSWGNDTFGNKDAEYCDPYCVMSHSIYGYKAPYSVGLPTWVTAPSGLPAGWTAQMAPLPTPVLMRGWLPPGSVAHLDASYRTKPATIALRAYGTGYGADPVLVQVDTGTSTWFAELRMPGGWDRGIDGGIKTGPTGASVASPASGVVIHRLNSGHVTHMGTVRVPRAGRAEYVSDKDDIRFSVLSSMSSDVPVRISAAAPDGSAGIELRTVDSEGTSLLQSAGHAMLGPEVGLCQPGDYTYSVWERETRVDAVAAAWGLGNFSLQWAINGVPVTTPPGTSVKMTVPAMKSSPGPFGPVPSLSGNAEVTVVVDGPTLRVQTRPMDGNWDLEVAITATGTGQRKDSETIGITGRTLEWEPRLKDDVSECLREKIGEIYVEPLPEIKIKWPPPGEPPPGWIQASDWVSFVSLFGPIIDIVPTMTEALRQDVARILAVRFAAPSDKVLRYLVGPSRESASPDRR